MNTRHFFLGLLLLVLPQTVIAESVELGAFQATKKPNSCVLDYRPNKYNSNFVMSQDKGQTAYIVFITSGMGMPLTKAGLGSVSLKNGENLNSKLEARFSEILTANSGSRGQLVQVELSAGIVVDSIKYTDSVLFKAPNGLEFRLPLKDGKMAGAWWQANC